MLGGLVGALTSKSVLDHFGRKHGLLFHLLFALLGAAAVFGASRLAPSKLAPLLLKLGRFLQGVQGGLSCSLVPTYLSEIAPARLRGQTGTVHNLFLTLGLACAQLLGFGGLLGNERHWAYLLAAPMVPALVGGFVLFLFVEETPKCLLYERGDENATIRGEFCDSVGGGDSDWFLLQGDIF